jgi:hypothetical protein
MIRIFIIIALSISTLNTRAQTKVPFKTGEELYYNFNYGFLLGGKGTLKVQTVYIDGRQLIHTKAVGKTAGIFSSLYNVRDVYESYIDPVTDLPVKHIRNIKEGRYRRYDEAIFNRDSSTVFSSRKNDTVRVAQRAHDILSVFYFARKHIFKKGMKKGDTISFDTYFAGKTFKARILYKGKETIDTKFGGIVCYKFNPIVKKGKLFKKENSIEVFISADDNKIPIRIRFEIWLGALVCELDAYRGLSNSFRVITK